MTYRVMYTGGCLIAAAGCAAAAVLFFRLKIAAAVRNLLFMHRHFDADKRRRFALRAGLIALAVIPAICLGSRIIRAEPPSKGRGAMTDPFVRGPWPTDESGLWPDESGQWPDESGLWPDESGLWPEESGRRTEESERRPDEEMAAPDRCDVCVRMEGGRRDDAGDWFYRGDNCGIRLVAYSDGDEAKRGARLFLDGKEITEEAAVSRGADGETICTFSSDAIGGCLREDGRHTVSVMAGGERVRYEGLRAEGAQGTFILDRVPPACSVRIEAPEASRKEKQQEGDRYYLNSSCRVTISFTDAWADPSLWEVMRGSVSQGAYNSEEVAIHAFPVKIEGNACIFEDELASDGVYRYRAGGCDKAGNAPLFEAGCGFDKEGKSDHIVIDRTKPEGVLEIAAGGRGIYKMTSGGAVVRNEGIASAEEAAVLIRSSVRTEHSPVRIECAASASPAIRLRRSASKEYRYGAALRFKVPGRRAFRISEWMLEDRAGNRSSAAMPGEIRLDPDPPVILSFSSTEGAQGTTRDGVLLFSHDVRIRAEIRDEGEGEGGTGIGSAVCLILDETGETEEKSVLYKAGKETAYLAEGVLNIGAAGHEGRTLTAVLRTADRAGNISEASFRFSIDTKPPSVKVIYEDNDMRNGFYLPHGRRARVEVTDRNVDPSGIRIHTGNADVTGSFSKTRGRGGEEVWRADILFEADGTYDVSAEASDLAGNRSGEASFEGAAPRHFVIDQTPPSVSVKGMRQRRRSAGFFPKQRRLGAIPGPACFCTGQRIELEVLDDHFAGGHRISAGEDAGQSRLVFSGNRAVLDLSEEGTYRIAGSVTDLAGNETVLQRTRAFIIDRTPPEIDVEGVKDQSANAQPVRIRVRVRDRHATETGLRCFIQKDGGKRESAAYALTRTGDGWLCELDPVIDDGFYHIEMTAFDAAGNRTVTGRTFSVNCRGTVFEFEQAELCRNWISEEIRPSFLIHDVDTVTILSVTVNGEECAYHYEGNRLTLSDALRVDGVYRIGIETVDAAKHVSSMEEAEIRIDRTAPALTVLGVKDGAVRKAPVTIHLIPDDPDAVFGELMLDGRDLREDITGSGNGKADADSLPEDPARERTGEGGTSGEKEPGSVTLTVTRRGTHTLSAYLTDPAGNTSARYTAVFSVTGNPLQLLLGNKRLLFTVAAALVVFIVFLKLKLDGDRPHRL